MKLLSVPFNSTTALILVGPQNVSMNLQTAQVYRL